MTKKFLALLAALAVVAAACGDSSSDADSTPAGAPTTTSTSTTTAATTPATSQAPAVVEQTPAAPSDPTDLSTKPVIAAPGGTPPSDLVINDLVVGQGDEAMAGSVVSVQYVGVRFDDGGEFDASWNRGQPFEFELGAGLVIPGWDRGVAGMRVGGRRELIIPPALGYGDRGAGADIPPGAALIFVVDLIEIVPTFAAPSATADGTIVIANQGGEFEGHVPWSSNGGGTGLFAGDNLSPDFPNDEGIEILLAFSLADINEIESGRQIVRAELTSRTMQTAGTPFDDLGALSAAAVDYTTFPPAADQRDPISEPVACEADIEAQLLTCDVTAAINQVVDDNLERVNFRLRYDTASDEDGEPDLVVFFFTDPNSNERGIFLLEIEFGDSE